MEKTPQDKERALEEMVYTVVHELKTPIREISLYAEFIEEDNWKQLPEQALEDLHAIKRVCSGMTEMVSSLMTYSKADLKPMETVRLDMNELIRQCFDEKLLAEPGREVVLETEPLPEILGDAFLIRLIVANILSNSIKFTRSRVRGKISVRAERLKGQIRFHFKDNGIGFDMHYADRIFEPFERLCSDESFEGNGIGLAAVKRAVGRFDGEVLIRAKAQKGCEVIVAFPERMLAPKAADPAEKHQIKIGVIGDLSGVASREERSKQAAYRMAVDEINAAGGIDGKEVVLMVKDDHSDSARTERAAKVLTEEEQVDVLMGSTLSPSRDIMQKWAQKTRTLYLNTQQTEGGVCGHYVFCLSAIPEQQMEAMLRYLIQKQGPKCYVIAADYNYGILSAEWAKYLIRKLGGEVVGIEYLDDQTLDFHSVIDRIQQVKTDVLVSMCVYPNQDQFYLQWYERGMNLKIPNATTQVAAEFPLNVEMAAPILENTYVMASFIEESPRASAEEFVKQFRKKYHKKSIPYMTMDAETAYSAVYLYKLAVETAGTTETEAVIRALESGRITFDGPGGPVTVRGEDHHTIREMICFRIDSSHRLREVFRTGPIASTYIDSMIEKKHGVKGGIKAMGPSVENLQYNMLLDKIR